MIRVLLLFCYCLFTASGWAQTVSLVVQGEDFVWDGGDTLRFEGSGALIDFLSTWRAQQRAKAYWEASVDTLLQLDSLNFRALLHQGPAYVWGEVRAEKDIPIAWLRRAGYRPGAYRNKPLDYAKWEALRDSLTTTAASAGYPFASTILDSVRWLSPGNLSAVISLQKGNLLRFASPEVPENAGIDAVFLARFLGIEAGKPYNYRLIRSLPNRLQQLPYLLLKGAPSLTFGAEEVGLVLPIERKAASRFDFVIGVLPNSAQTGDLLLTGELKGEFINSLGQGERIAVGFEQLRPQTQELELAFDYPYLFKTPFGAALRGDLYRRDTQFINLNYRLAGTYSWQANNSLQFYWEQRQTNLLSFNENLVLSQQRLPDTLDVSRSFFGLGVSRQTVNQAFNPTSGYLVRLEVAAGQRRVERNSQLLELGLGALYDSLSERSAQYQLGLEADFYQPFLAGTVFYAGLRAAAYLSEAPLLANEQYRIGGAQLLRGFDEQQIFASAYAIVSTEIRLQLGREAYLYGFGDFAYVDVRNRNKPDAAADFPVGFGAGVNFSTPAGIFGLTLALGRRRGEILDLGAPKVHFGYLSVF